MLTIPTRVGRTEDLFGKVTPFWMAAYLLFADLLSRLALPGETDIVFGQGRGCST
jgi:hypothetical protein